MADLEKIGSLFGPLVEQVKALQVVKPAKPAVSEAQRKFLNGVTAMKLDPLDAECVFLARFLIQCTLPHSDPGDVPVWTRKNGLYTLGIQPGWDFDAGCSLGYPWGSMPRLLLVWIVTEAKRTASRRLDLGDSLARFMLELGLNPAMGSGKRSDSRRLREAMRRLFGARISFYQHISDGRRQGEAQRDMQVAPERELWWDAKSPGQGALWGSWIELGDKFYSAIMESTVPCDMRALRLLKRSPLALDLYVLCNWIGSNLGSKPHHFISWEMLGQQMGGDYANIGDLRRKIKAELRKVKLAHPGLNVSYPPKGGGILIKPGVPAVPRRLPASPKPPRIG